MTKQRAFRWAAGVGLGLLVLLFLAAGYPPLGALLTELPFGWWHFLARNLPQLSLNWGLLSTGLICSALIVLLGNGLLRALYRQWHPATPTGASSRQWPWRWTFCIYTGLWLLFAVAFGAAGLFRHTTWLMADDQRWYEPRLRAYYDLRSADRLVQLAQVDNLDLEATRKAIAGETWYQNPKHLMVDEFNVLLYGDQSNQVVAYVIIPRHPRLMKPAMFGVSWPDTNLVLRPLPELSQAIAELDARFGPANHRH